MDAQAAPGLKPPRTLLVWKQEIQPRSQGADRARVPQAVQDRLIESLSLFRVNEKNLREAYERRDLLGAAQAVEAGLAEESLWHALQAMILLQVEEAGRKAAADLRRLLRRPAEKSVRKQNQVMGEFDLINPESVEYARTASARLVTRVSADIKAAIQDLVVRSFREGRTGDQLARDVREIIGLLPRQATALENFRRRLEQAGRTPAKIADLTEGYRRRLLLQRARMIARTEIIGSSTQGQHGVWGQAVEQNLIGPKTQRVWIDTSDDRECFLAGTRISTPDGIKPIEDLSPGIIVDTHLGPRRVIATKARVTDCAIIAITLDHANIFATADHPFLKIVARKAEWCRADKLKQGDLLCQMQRPSEGRLNSDCFYLTLGDSGDEPSIFFQPDGLTHITPLVAVPIISVHLQNKPAVAQQEIHTISAYSGFLDKFNLTASQFFPYRFLKQGFASALAIARKGAELSVFLGRHVAEFLFTSLARCNYRRSAAQFRAVFTRALFIVKSLSAPLASCIICFAPSALQRAYCVPGSDARSNRERIPADGACLLDQPSLLKSTITISAAESSGLSSCSWRAIKNLAAVGATQIRKHSGAGMVAGGRAILRAALKCFPTPDAFQHNKSIIADHGTVVYSIQTEGAATFFAEKTLVHNCDLCADMHGKTATLGQPYDDGSMGPPLHPSCFPGDTLITASPRIAAVSKRWYDGKLIVIRTASGKQLSPTPNHPILTRTGWVAAHLLSKGDYVIGSLAANREFSADDNNQHIPATLEEIAHSFGSAPEMTAAEVPLTAIDFNTDAGDGQVAIIWSNSHLRNYRKTSRPKQVCKLSLIFGKAAKFLNSSCSLAEFCESNAAALAGLMRGGYLSLLLAGGHPSPFQFFGLAPSALRNRAVSEASGNDGTANAKFVSQCLAGSSGEVKADNFFTRNFNPRLAAWRKRWRTQLDIHAAEPTSNGSALDAQLAREIARASSGQILADEIVGIDEMPFHGYVYNLETKQGFYVANGIITHNCRCTEGLTEIDAM